MTSIVDSIIILFLLMGAIAGFKRGVIKSATMFVGAIVVLILSFWLLGSSCIVAEIKCEKVS